MYTTNSVSIFSSAPQKNRPNVPAFPVPSVFRTAVQRHNLRNGGKKKRASAEAKIKDEYTKFLQELSECEKVTLNKHDYLEILRLGLSIEATETKNEFRPFKSEVVVTKIQNDLENVLYKIVYLEPLKTKSPIKGRDVIEISPKNSPTSTFYEMKVISTSTNFLTVETSLDDE